ncbi:MAG: hypothetical protein IPI45_14195 [Saprospiraceae bacterium]|nr:hypothetical protein [Saprospiraceae bacterium]MBK7738918.1 hypothetical protein [Saprospiraceae bacterium]MBK7912515.1 hypothetical protein [Saprospiraceae bacterium]
MQLSSLEDSIDQENPVRFIDAFVEQLDLVKLGFEVRIKGSHYIYYKESIQEIINIQEIGGHSKAYQVKQIREIIINYKLEIQEDDES